MPWPFPSFVFGADYNPEQWDPDVWREDIRLMTEAKVNLVSVGIFAWALFEPEPGTFHFDWLDRVLDLLDEAGIGVNLANATASPPPWMAVLYPETLPVTRQGNTMGTGARQAYCPSSPIFRERAAILTDQMGTRYGRHPALRMWHVSNEFGCHNARCYCDVSALAFRRWLRDRYESLDELNRCWGTAFWSQHYSAWDEIRPPRLAPTFTNPTQELDFARFSSDEVLATYLSERQVLQRHTPHVPISTNFMVSKFISDLDYWSWAPHVDVVANDHYLDAADPHAHIELAFAADLTRGLAAGSPWMLMEHSTSAVNWQPRNRAKLPGEMGRNSFQHIARGSNGAMFFQWRASRAGAEKYHSAMVPHAGTETTIWTEVLELGQRLELLTPALETKVEAEVAMIFDWQNWWNAQLSAHPTELDYLDQANALYRTLWESGITVQFVPTGGSLDGYRLVLVPTLTMMGEQAAAEIDRYVVDGGTAVVTYFSGIVDEHDHVWLGGYPALLTQTLGVRTEEFYPLGPDETVELSNGARAGFWIEHTHLEGAQAVASYQTGPLPGRPAITRHRRGKGEAWYLGTRLAASDLQTLLTEVTAAAEVRPTVAGLSVGIEAVRRTGPKGSFLFLINHTTENVSVAVAGRDLFSSKPVTVTEIPAGGIAVIAEAPSSGEGI